MPILLVIKAPEPGAAGGATDCETAAEEGAVGCGAGVRAATIWVEGAGVVGGGAAGVAAVETGATGLFESALIGATSGLAEAGTPCEELVDAGAWG
jgi:hypothetical protein